MLTANRRLADPRLLELAAIRRRLRLQRQSTVHTLAALDHWHAWLPACFPSYFSYDFATHQADFWEHIWSVKPGVRPVPIIALWPRGGGKSSSAEPAVITLGVHGGRRYGVYVSGTQGQADQHVESIAAILESPSFAEKYPSFANRRLGKYGHSKGWRRNRLRTEAGLTIDAAGLDKAVRGIKEEGHRPDIIVLDDVDNVLDSPSTVQRKLTTLTRSILPAGSHDVAIIGVQNLIHADSVFSRFADGRADFLVDRQMSGPIPAIAGLTYELRAGKYVITGGQPTWAGQDLAHCQALMDDIGLTSFLIEAQHDVEDVKGGIYEHIEFQHCDWEEVPELVRIVVWVDPAVTNTDDSDAYGIQADGLGVDHKIYRLFSWEDRTSPEDALQRAIRKAMELKAECVGVETDQGGDTWKATYRLAAQEIGIKSPPPFRSAKAGAGHGPKAHRQAQMVSAYERGRFVHVRGTHVTLERALRRFGLRKPYDLADACYWAYEDLNRPPAQDVSQDEMKRIWAEVDREEVEAPETVGGYGSRSAMRRTFR